MKDWQVIPSDPTEIEWSLERWGKPTLSAQLNNYVRTPGKTVEAFLNLSDGLLGRYALVAPAERPQVARDINKHANQLLSGG
jgi:hypothetical protein